MTVISICHDQTSSCSKAAGSHNQRHWEQINVFAELSIADETLPRGAWGTLRENYGNTIFFKYDIWSEPLGTKKATYHTIDVDEGICPLRQQLYYVHQQPQQVYFEHIDK